MRAVNWACALAAALGTLICASSALAWTPVPPPHPSHVASADVPDRFDPLREFLASRESASQARYEVLIVAFSDPEDRRGAEYGDLTSAYIDRVVLHWSEHLTLQREVLIVVSLENRDLIVHPGAHWLELGFFGELLGNTIDNSGFAAQASAGNFNTALERLIVAIDLELERREALWQDRATTVREGIPIAERTHQTLETRLDDNFDLDDPEVAEVRGVLSQSRDNLVEALTLQEQGNFEDAELLLIVSQEQTRRAEAVLERLEETRHLRGFVFPLLVLGGLLILFSLGMGLLVLRRNELRRRSAETLDRWHTLLGTASERLLDLENNHPLVFGRPNLGEHFEGKTQQPIRQLAEDLGELFMLYEVSQKQFRCARRQHDNAKFPWLNDYAKSRALLTTEMVVAHTQDVASHRLFSPRKHRVRLEAATMLDRMDSEYAGISLRVGTFEQQLHEVWARLDAGNNRLRDLETQLEEIEALEAPTEALDESLVQWTDQLVELTRLAECDPLGSLEALGAVEEGITSRVDVFGRLSEALETRVKLIVPGRESVAQQITELREDGWTLDEPGFEPDASLSLVDALAETVLNAAEEGDADEAQRAAREGQETLEEVRKLIICSETSKSSSPAAIAELRRNLARTRETLPSHAARLGALEAEHAASALMPALDNIEEVNEILDDAQTLLDTAAEYLEPETQRYLGAEELIQRAQDHSDSVQGLFDEIDRKKDELLALKERSLNGLGLAVAVQAAIEAEPTADISRLGPAQTDLIDVVTTEISDLQSECEAARPDWIAIDARSHDLLARIEALREDVTDTLTALRDAEALLETLPALQEALTSRLAATEEECETTHERFRETVAHLESATEAAHQPVVEWHELLSQLKQTERDFELTQQLLEADVAAAAQARTQYVETLERITRARAHRLEYGIALNATMAQSRLEAARAALHDRRYDEAARLSRVAAEALSSSVRATETAVRVERQSRLRKRRITNDGARRSARRSWSSGSSRTSFGSTSGRSSFGSSSRRKSSSSSRSSGYKSRSSFSSTRRSSFKSSSSFKSRSSRSKSSFRKK